MPPALGADLRLPSPQRCCHCCLLGRAAQAQAQSCEPSLMLGYQCGLVFRACCVRGQESTDFAPGDVGDPQENGNSSVPPGQCIVRLFQDVCLSVSHVRISVCVPL